MVPRFASTFRTATAYLNRIQIVFRWAVPVVCRILEINESQTQLDQILFLLFYMFRTFLIRPSSGRSFFVEETVKFYTISYVKIK